MVDNSPVEEQTSQAPDKDVSADDYGKAMFFDAGALIKKDIDISAFDLYKIIVDTRKFEIDNFWKRTLFFWGTFALLILGYFNIKEHDEYLIFVAYLGFFFNLIFSFSIRGSKYWQEHWETLAVKFERHLKFKIFRWEPGTLIKDNNEDVYKPLRPYRFSLSKLTMVLADITLVYWFTLIVTNWVNLIKYDKVFFQPLLNFSFPAWYFRLTASFHPYTFAAILIPALCTYYIFKFIRTETKREKLKKMMPVD